MVAAIVCMEEKWGAADLLQVAYRRRYTLGRQQHGSTWINGILCFHYYCGNTTSCIICLATKKKKKKKKVNKWMITSVTQYWRASIVVHWTHAPCAWMLEWWRTFQEEFPGTLRYWNNITVKTTSLHMTQAPQSNHESDRKMMMI